MLYLSLGIVLCYLGLIFGGVDWVIFLLFLLGLFMLMIYLILNFKGIFCFVV